VLLLAAFHFPLSALEEKKGDTLDVISCTSCPAVSLCKQLKMPHITLGLLKCGTISCSLSPPTTGKWKEQHIRPKGNKEYETGSVKQMLIG
jgi:hypothetical protein